MKFNLENQGLNNETATKCESEIMRRGSRLISNLQTPLGRGGLEKRASFLSFDFP